ncbi:MAG: hypothetical protein ABW034_08650 [Steroidobacteraceae bacterium]
MRVLAIAGLLTTLIGCAATPTSTPREYLDQQTAATIKVVADPLVFAQDPSSGGRDFLNVYALDVNRMGQHQQYLAVLQWWPEQGAAAAAANPAMLQLETPGQTHSLSAATQSARELGIAERIDPTAPREGAWFYFPVSKEVLAQVSQASSMRATLVLGERRVAYTLWQDNRAELTELAEALP